MSRWRSLLALGIGLTACTAAAQEVYSVDWEEVCAGGTTVLPVGVQVSVSGGACEFPTGPNFYVGQVIVISFSLDPGYGNPEEFLGVSNAGANFGRAYPNPCCPPPFPGASHCCEHTWVKTDDQGRMHGSSWSSPPLLGPAPFDGIHRITIDGRPGYISMGDIVFELTTECSVGTGDTDGDGLPDVWEECGLNVGEDGEPETCLVRPCDLSLRDMGADPEHKDLFVEIDWMDAGPHARGHWPRRIGMDRIRESFAKAGINLHLDTGQSSVMDPQTGRRWRSLSRSNSVNHVNKLGNCTNDPEDPVCNPTIWSDFDAIKGANFEKLREPVFRYGLIAHHIDDLGTSGLVRDIPGSDFIVSLGDWHPSGGGTPKEQGGTLQHELGHALGLRHGGGDNVGWKPNYLSVMNYWFQVDGLVHRGGAPLFDYSGIRLPDLNEADLDEPDGISGGDPGLAAALTDYGTRFQCINLDWIAPHAAGPIDWDCDGVQNERGIASSLDDDPALRVFTGYEDWSNLVFRAGSIGLLGAGPLRRASAATGGELTLAEAATITRPFDVVVEGPREIQLPDGEPATFVFGVRNIGESPDEYDLFATSAERAFDFSLQTSSLQLAPGERAEVEITVELREGAHPRSEDELSLYVSSMGDPAISDEDRVFLSLVPEPAGLFLRLAALAALTGLRLRAGLRAPPVQDEHRDCRLRSAPWERPLRP